MEEKVSISISKETHARIKKHCDEYAFKIGSWIDNVLCEKLKELKK
jgi:hypothetical protein